MDFDIEVDDRPRCIHCDALCFENRIPGKKTKETWCSRGCHLRRRRGELRGDTKFYADLYW